MTGIRTGLSGLGLKRVAMCRAGAKLAQAGVAA